MDLEPGWVLILGLETVSGCENMFGKELSVRHENWSLTVSIVVIWAIQFQNGRGFEAGFAIELLIAIGLT